MLRQDKGLLTEVIYIDDCSSDNTYSIAVKALSSAGISVTSIRNSTNLGAFKTFNLCHSLANNQFVCHLDGDDVWQESKVSLQYAVMNQNPECCASWHLLRHVSDHNSEVDNKSPAGFQPTCRKVTIKDLILRGSLGATSSLMYRKSAYKEMEEPFFDHTLAVALLEDAPGILIESEMGYYLTSSPSSLSRNSRFLCELYFDTLAIFFVKYPQYREYTISRAACMILIWSKSNSDFALRTLRDLVFPAITYFRMNLFLVSVSHYMRTVLIMRTKAFY